MSKILSLWLGSHLALGVGYCFLVAWVILGYQMWRASVNGSKDPMFLWLGITLELIATITMFVVGALILRDPYVLWHTLYNLTKMLLLGLLVMQSCFSVGYKLTEALYPHLSYWWKKGVLLVSNKWFSSTSPKKSPKQDKLSRLAQKLESKS